MMRLEVTPLFQPGEETEPFQPGMFDPADSFSASGFDDQALDNFQKSWMDRQGFAAFLSYFKQSMDSDSDDAQTTLQEFEIDRLFQALAPNQRGRISAYRLMDFLSLAGHPRTIYDMQGQCDSMQKILSALRKKYLEANRCVMLARCCSIVLANVCDSLSNRASNPTHDGDDDVHRPAKILSVDAKPYHFFEPIRTDNLQNKEFNQKKTKEMSSADHWKQYKANMDGSAAALKFIESTRGMAV